MVVASLDEKMWSNCQQICGRLGYYFTKVQWGREKRHCAKNYGTWNCEGTFAQAH